MNFEKYYVLDTNIILEDATNIFKLSDDGKNLIVLPETVLDEIDSKKSGFDEINFQARQFARTLENSEILETKNENDYSFVRVKIVSDTTTYIDIVSSKNYKISEKNVSLNILNDRKILQITEYLNNYYNKQVEF
ncbi:MAG: PIN domain-containing protein, partial [Sulfurovum sp.]